MPRFLTVLLIIFFFACISKDKKLHKPDALAISKLNSDRKVSPYNNFFKLSKATDSTFNLVWGNSEFSSQYNKVLDSRTAERIHYQWENKEYLVLQYGIGSDAWMNLVLPLNANEEVQEFGNGLAFDSTNNLLVVQYHADTILYVQNLKTSEKQYVVDKTHSCGSASILYCIDSLQISDRILSFNWITPTKLNKKRQTYKRRIKINKA